MAKQRGRGPNPRTSTNASGSRTGTRPAGTARARDTKAAQEQARRVLEEQRRAIQRRQRLLVASGAVAIVVVAVAVMVAVKLTGGGTKAKPAPKAAEPVAEVVAAATGVPAAVLDKVGRGKVDTLPKSVSGQQPLTADGKPLVVYLGAEYCPFCAGQRWPMVVALSRFGTFSNLGVSYSATDDVYPGTKTLSFHGSTYTSQYLAFQGVEFKSNVRTKNGNDYEPLDTPTKEQMQLMQTLNNPPYVDKESAGSIPFVDFGNRYIMVGGSISPELLKGKSAVEISKALHEPDTDIAKGVDGAANAFTAILCKLTNGQPGEVCTAPGVSAYAGKL